MPTIMATLHTQGFFFPNSNFQRIVKDQFKRDVSLSYVLGLLNSALIRRYYLQASQVEGTTKPQLAAAKGSRLVVELLLDGSIVTAKPALYTARRIRNQFKANLEP